jgi:hypothetical protein
LGNDAANLALALLARSAAEEATEIALAEATTGKVLTSGPAPGEAHGVLDTRRRLRFGAPGLRFGAPTSTPRV